MRIQEILMCPKCGGGLHKDLKCEKCGSIYESRLGVYNLLYEELNADYEFSFWQIDENEIEETIRQYEALETAYRESLTEECRAAEAKLDAHIQTLVEALRGTVVDIATGRGMFLEKILKWNPGLHLIGTDIDAAVLAVTGQVRKCVEKVDFLGCDSRHIALKEESVDHVISFMGLANMPDTVQVVSEIYRILKKGGTFLYKGTFLEPDSRSYQMLKEQYGMEKAMDLKLLRELLENAGFDVMEAQIIAEAEWGENPYDRFPLTGDKNCYGVIQVRK